MKKNIVIIILSVLVVVLGCTLGYLLINKDVNTKSTKETNEIVEEQNETIDQKDEDYFNEYLKVFLGCNGTKVSRNTENFNDDDIFYFVTNYYTLKHLSDDIQSNSGEYEYIVSKKEVDEIVYKYFNKKNYNIEKSENIYTIKSEDDNYIISWSAVGCFYTLYKDIKVEYNGLEVTVSYNEYNTLPEIEANGNKLIFHLKYNNGEYNIIKIEYIES